MHIDAGGEALVDGAVGGVGTAELSTATTALPAGVRPPVQAEIVPSSVAKMKEAASVVPGTWNAVDGFHTMPVGEAGVGCGGLFGSIGWHAVAGTTLPGSGIDTCSATLAPSPP